MQTWCRLKRTDPDPDSSLSDDLPCKATSREAALLATAEKRWAAALLGARFEQSRQAEKPQPRLRGLPPGEHRHGSSLLQGVNSI